MFKTCGLVLEGEKKKKKIITTTITTTKTTAVTDERKNVWRRRHVFGDEHQEHGHRQQSRDAHRHFFARVARNVEAEQRDERDNETRHDHVEHVEERLAPHLDRVGDVRVPGKKQVSLTLDSPEKRRWCQYKAHLNSVGVAKVRLTWEAQVMSGYGSAQHE